MIDMPIFPFNMAFPPLYSTREIANYVRESFIWHRRRATCPPHPFPEDYHVLCPTFSLPEAKGTAADFELPEMVQATFYAMVLSETVELGVVHGFMTEGLKLALVGLRWSSFETWMSRVDHELREVQLRLLLSDYHSLYPRFDLEVATRYAREHPDMVRIIFYIMVIDKATELGPSRRLTMNCVMWVMRKLDWGFMEAWLGHNARRLR
ncbi:hypothetical protein Cgig2_014110 [Carnegiea gigantea]|uniref:Uncharacterized protein n=1 Tax=Carnegiea gigantea TaxID=171969 RepID=A0A9Q1KYQ8_9CARY|nr:hypothetical protein Cgig2_014110 [Carnegiea gigantea]